MKRARKWLLELSQGSTRSSRPRCAPRRLLMPERLESRNAPGAMIPLLPLFSPAGESSDDFDGEPANRLGTRQYYRADSIAPSPELHFSIQSFIDALRAEEAASQQSQSQRQIAQQTAQYNLDADAATLSRAFESLFVDSISPAIFAVLPVVAEVPPPVIQPVEPGPEPEEPSSAPEAIAEPTPTGSESNSQSSPTTALPPATEPVVPATPAPVEIPPPVIQPVESGPEPEEPAVDGEITSETPAAPVEQPITQPVIEDPPASVPVVEAPNPPVDIDEQISEIPPPMIQPVIMDPESEHNQPSPEPAVAEEVAPVEPAVEVTDPEPIAEQAPVIETDTSIEPAMPVEAEPQVEAPTVPEPVVEPVAEVEPETPISEPAPTVTPPTTDPEPAVVPPAVIQPVVTPPVSALSTPDQLSATDVEELLERAARVTASDDAIIAIVDRNGRILGVHVEGGVITAIPDIATRVFAIDGAIAKARTAAFFSNNQAILTSRTVRFISQTTITQREVEANPNSTLESIRGPGFVAPIGVGGHFPPDVPYTPPVDLFAIEHTNRDSLVHPGVDGIKQTVDVDASGNPIAKNGDDKFLVERFGADFIDGQEIAAPESYGLVSGLLTNAQSRGIATLPGGVPLYKADPMDGNKMKLVGGIGVFFPGADGYATHEQGFVAGINQTTLARLNAPLVLEAEYIATVIAKNVATIDGLPPVDDIGLLALPGGGRIDLGGITLESFGPHPYKLDSFITLGQSLFSTGVTTGSRARVTPAGDTAIAGEPVPTGWLVNPTAGTNLTAQQVEDIIERGIDEAELVRAAIRLPLGTRTSMVLAVADTDGKVLGLYRMEDATVFSIDVAVAKARNVVYYADPNEIKDVDRVPGVDAGVAFTNRTFRYLTEPRFPTGSEFTVAPPFSTLLTPGVNPQTAENMPGVIPDASDFTTALGYDAFNPGTNFHEDVSSAGYQNGVVFFPGSTPLYNGTVLVGGFGVSGDGVDQDDVVTYFGAGEFLPGKDSPIVRADEVFVRDVRLPYQKFLRNPHG